MEQGYTCLFAPGFDGNTFTEFSQACQGFVYAARCIWSDGELQDRHIPAIVTVASVEEYQ